MWRCAGLLARAMMIRGDVAIGGHDVIYRIRAGYWLLATTKLTDKVSFNVPVGSCIRMYGGTKLRRSLMFD